MTNPIVPNENCRLHFLSEDMPPERRLQRIVELLAIASIRLATEQGNAPNQPDSEDKKQLGFSAERR